MAIRIESLRVENLRQFEGEYQLEFNAVDTPEIIVGRNSTGKTTLADSIQLCLTGEYGSRPHLAPLELVNQLSTGEEASGEIGVIIRDTVTESRYRLIRPFQTTETRRGPIDSVGSLNAVKKEDGEWVDIDSSTVVDAIFPVSSIPFTILDAETTLGIKDQWGGTGFDELVDLVADAATVQAVARDEPVPSYVETDERLAEALLDQINDLRLGQLERYTVEHKDGSLVAMADDDDMSSALATEERTLLSIITAVAVADLLPTIPPLIGDTMFGRLSRRGRENVQELLLDQPNRQFLLFGLQREFDDIELSPTYELEYADPTTTRIINRS